MPRTANVHTHVDSDTKEQAKKIKGKLLNAVKIQGKIVDKNCILLGK